MGQFENMNRSNMKTGSPPPPPIRLVSQMTGPHFNPIVVYYGNALYLLFLVVKVPKRRFNATDPLVSYSQAACFLSRNIEMQLEMYPIYFQVLEMPSASHCLLELLILNTFDTFVDTISYSFWKICHNCMMIQLQHTLYRVSQKKRNGGFFNPLQSESAISFYIIK